MGSHAAVDRPAKILEVASYPPPRSGWAVRVEYLKRSLECHGHECVVLNVGASRMIPSTEYETVLGAGESVRKVWRYCRRGYVVHAHANGDSVKGLTYPNWATMYLLDALMCRQTIPVSG